MMYTPSRKSCCSSESVSQFVCHRYKTYTRNQCVSTIFPSRGSNTSDAPPATLTNSRHMVSKDEVSVCSEIKCLANFAGHSTSCVVMIVALGVLPIHTMHCWFALGIGFNAEGYLPITVRFHLFSIEGLNIENLFFHLLHHAGAIRSVLGGEVN